MQIETFGQDHLPPLVFLHGFLGKPEDWYYFAQALSSNFFCLIPNLLDRDAKTLSSLSQKLQNSLESLAKPYKIVGYSMGGRLALRYSLDFPDSIEGLIIASASPGIENHQERKIRLAQDEQLAQILQSKGIKYFLDYWYGNTLFDSLREHEIFANLLERRAQIDPHLAAAILSNLSPAREPSMWQQLPHLNCPTLLVAGSLDPKYIEVLQRANNLLPRAKFKILPDVGHALHIENPKLFLETIEDFLLNKW